MLLTVDIGNTTVAIAGLRGEEVAFVKKLPSDPALDWTAALKGLLEGVEAQGAVLSSVVPALTGPVGEGLKALTGKPVLVVDKSTDTGLDLRGYDTANLGMDRVVDCVAALARYNPPAAVFDMGTATTLSVVDRGGVFRGGMILPGLALGLEALSARAAQLPPITLSAPQGLLGTDTVSCMGYGALYGAAGAIEGIVARLEQELGPLTVVLTGGNSTLVRPLLRISTAWEPHLTFLGLGEIWRRRQP
ncbi:type III pantothenate kinase [Flavonifractor sp. An82]|uniref:type III pantothenate kinase n=1 Tax=Flavonifractor sp. An82 TaxID=1965660 RepID=UPI000B392042|nr:type III pantothenate kinase [Flavonifractor sp. An82]OUN22852.1 type III pantothenate kinase [Flavonifractor sp. An82]